ncbi:hypothetical protein HBH92_154020 [Parastagonospora nodorum]|nr:hypothetical protein HBH92_154020 [Parastagonospora nodorum]KAH4442286.1 hypothetical protein HBH93_078030 [Parastagonospora nodorum]KAH4453905.1 hypothetical protein HBH91_106260 [Parastagonospora nodorum]KAH4510315.1 hypothetical protein HBH89_056590 [Parastagonospora nodorum]KAH4546584.1 hypothetical protein HBH86_139950 [Parastagonospora nodorum]
MYRLSSHFHTHTIIITTPTSPHRTTATITTIYSPYIYTNATFHSECYKPVEQGDCDVCIKQIRSADAKPHEHGIEDEAEPGIKITAYGYVLGKECAIQWFEEAN